MVNYSVVREVIFEHVASVLALVRRAATGIQVLIKSLFVAKGEGKRMNGPGAADKYLISFPFYLS